ncbi:hypothetical protein BH24ACT16_BH24ACT16_11350 [soil metagenome]
MRLAGSRGSGQRLALALAVTLLVLALAAGCGESSQSSRDAGSADGASSGETEPREAVQGTTSENSTRQAESTVGTLPPQTSESEGAESSAGSGSSGSAGAANTEDATDSSGGSSGAQDTAGSAGSAASSAQAGEASTPSQGGEAQAAQAVLDAGEFVASPTDGGGGGYMADSILGVRFGDHEGYERVVVDLGSGGQPTSGIPNWTLSSPTGDGRLKMTFPSVRNTAVSDGSLEGAGAELLKSFYVVRSPDGGMFVDFFAERAFYYRVVELPDPSRIAIDFASAGSELAIPLPVREGNTVLTQPRQGAGITSPMTVSGYSRNPEASNTIVLQGPGGATLARQTVLSNDWTATWGYFETSVDFQPFAGQGVLKVGTQSARDGSFEGVELPVTNSG